MSIVEIFGYLGALLVGVSLGLTGGGGSILALPVMVYLHHKSPEIARTYSLFIIGSGALIGVIQNYFLKRVNYKIALGFVSPSLIAIYLTSKFIYPLIPSILFNINDVVITKPIFLMILFAFVMLIAGGFMIKKGMSDSKNDDLQDTKINYFMIIILGLLTGTLTELLGAGGGFIIVPALVVFAKLPMKLAIGTSLLIIFINSLLGIIFHINTENVDWTYLGIFTSIALVGILVGTYLTKFINGNLLKIYFGIFVLIMGCFIIIEKIFIK